MLSRLRTSIREGWLEARVKALLPGQGWAISTVAINTMGAHPAGCLRWLRSVPHPLPQRFLLVAYDLHSKCPEVMATGSVTLCIVTDFLSSLFARWGLQNTITTDNGPQLISAEFAAFVEEKGIKHICTSFYHTEANGGFEWQNLSLKNGIRAHLVKGFKFFTALLRTLLHDWAHSTLNYRQLPSSTDVGPGFPCNG